AYLTAIVAHFRDVEGIGFDVLSPFNEPQWDWEAGTQEGCRYSIADMKRVIDALAQEQDLGNTEIEIPESGSILDIGGGEKYLQAFFDVESASFSGDQVAPRLASHSYKTDLPATGLVDRRLVLRAALDRYPRVQYAMTEFCPLGKHGPGRDLGMDTALLVARVMHFDLVVAGAATWQWWLAVSPYDYKDGLVYIEKNTDDGEFSESKLLWAMGNFSRFVRPGMVRLDVRRSDDATHGDTVEGLMVSSYLDRDRGIVATVFINWTEESTPVSLAVEGGVVNGWIPYVTSSESDLDASSEVPSNTTVLLPARSVVTLVGQVEESTDELIKGA
ncbi:MAG: xylanase, partial [Acidobacteria bacterium]|nr:xylanase [Candidatus Sulfomarinibacter kjeldsenii]